MKELLIRLLIIASLFSSLVMAESAKETLRERIQEHSEKDKALLESKLEDLGVNENEASMLLGDFELKTAQDLDAVSGLTEEESASLLNKPFFCTYEYRYHFAASRTIIENLEDLNSVQIAIALITSLPITMVIDTVMTPFSVWLAYSEPRNEEIMKDSKCY